MKEAISKRDYPKAAALARRNIQQVPGFVRDTRSEYGSFDIPSIPALQQGGTMLAIMGDREGIEELRRVAASMPELESWREAADDYLDDLRLFEAITEAVRQNPGCLQNSVKNLIGEDDGRRVSNLIAWLEKAGRIQRTRKGSTYALAIPGTAEAPARKPKRIVKSHRTGGAARVHDLDLSQLPYVSLPRAPLRWEERQDGRQPELVAEPAEPFEVRDSRDWNLASVEKVPMADRPDTAFRHLFAIDDGLILLDDLGNASAFPDAPAAALRFGRSGELIAAEPLQHDVYRRSANALGRGMIALSKEGAIHAYDNELRLVLETSLYDGPEVQALLRRLHASPDGLKNYLRTVALGYDNSRYLVTGVDEAWCVGLDGRALWSIRMPKQEGWTQVAAPGGAYGTSAEIQEALTVMDLRLPITPEDVKRRYRELAKSWHPDLHRGSPESERRMKDINNAAELLTGVEVSALPSYTGAVYEKVMGQSTSEGQGLTLSFGMVGGEMQAADWIYASGFAGRSHGAFLASYSGRIVQVDAGGVPVRAFDIGTVPRRIVDTGDYLYFLAETRLYVLRDDSLHAIVDTFEGGELVVGQTGFGLLENKRFRWFREDGCHLGTVVSKEPIRRVYHSGRGLVIETRQRRAVVAGAPTWWEA